MAIRLSVEIGLTPFHRRMVRAGLAAGIALACLAGGAAYAAFNTDGIEPNQPVKAAQIKENFVDLDGRLKTQDGRLTAVETRDVKFAAPVSTNVLQSSVATYASMSGVPTLTYAPTTTGKYKVSFSCPAATDNNAHLKINASSGSPTVLFEARAFFNAAAGTAVQRPFVIYQLTAGTSYTFEVQGHGEGGQCNLLPNNAGDSCALLLEQY